MAKVDVTEQEVRAAVDAVIDADGWPIYRTYDDNGLERSEYFDFARAVMRRLGVVKSIDHK